MNTASLLLVILAAGLSSQWLAWRIRIPAIVILIAVGLVLGPITDLIHFDVPAVDMAELIGLGVAIILFEGGMDLKLGEFRRVGNGIGRLTILGPPIAWALGSLAAHYIAGLSWAVASVLGAILIVTGPTVILPLLSQARLNKSSASLLKWEGIVNDPIGVLLAVLTFQYFTVVDSGLSNVLIHLSIAIGSAALFGGLGGWLTGWVFRHGGAPESAKAPILMVLVLVVYWLSNQAQHEAGLLSVTVMGLVLGNMKLVERETLQQFKEHLTILLLSVLFIVIPTQLNVSHLQQIDYRAVFFVLALLFAIRPISIGLATLGAPMSSQEKILLAWIAPRGIVAVAAASVFGPALVGAGYPDAEKLLPITFLVVITTVLVHGLTIGPLARRLELAAESENGLLIVGGSPFTTQLAKALKKLELDVLIVDGSYHHLKEARMAGIEIYYGELLSERAKETLEDMHLSSLLCATDNDFYNALVSKAQGREFGHHRVFQLAIHDEAQLEVNRLTLQQRGHIAFDHAATFELLSQRVEEGWMIQSSRLTEIHNFSEVEKRLGLCGKDWFLLAGLNPKGLFKLFSSEQSFVPETDWTLIIFAPSSATP